MGITMQLLCIERNSRSQLLSFLFLPFQVYSKLSLNTHTHTHTHTHKVSTAQQMAESSRGLLALLTAVPSAANGESPGRPAQAGSEAVTGKDDHTALLYLERYG